MKSFKTCSHIIELKSYDKPYCDKLKMFIDPTARPADCICNFCYNWTDRRKKGKKQ